MSNIVDTKKMIALEYLQLSAKNLSEATNEEDYFVQTKLRLHYLQLALTYGCTPDEIRSALGVSENVYSDLLPEMISN